MGGPDFVYASGLDRSFFLIFRKTGRHLFLQCFKFGKAMYIIRNKRVGMEGGGSIFHRGGGVHISQGNMDPRVHISLLNMDPRSIFRGGGSIFNMTPAHHAQDASGWIAS